MKKTILLIIAIIALILIVGVVKDIVADKEERRTDTTAEVTENETVDMEAACTSALAYMSFVSGEDADIFLEACIDGKHPDVIERYVVDMQGMEAADPNLPTSSATVEPLITITEPAKKAVVGSPITLAGTARGYWFFEATAPVDVYDPNGELIGQSYITATESWMTEDFVPFTGEITFDGAAELSGQTISVIFSRANPSGIPDNAESVMVLVEVE